MRFGERVVGRFRVSVVCDRVRLVSHVLVGTLVPVTARMRSVHIRVSAEDGVVHRAVRIPKGRLRAPEQKKHEETEAADPTQPRRCGCRHREHGLIVDGRDHAGKMPLRSCSRKRPTTLTTRVFSLMPG